MAGIIGDLCEDKKSLERVASERKKRCFEKSVEPGLTADYEADGWEVVRRGKTRTRVRKAKQTDILFEDRVWLIFYNLGFFHMNRDRKCRLDFDGYSKQIDVLARDENNIFVVECKSSESNTPINARGALGELVGNRKDVQRALEGQWGRHLGRIILVVAISSQDKREEDEDFLKAKKDSNAFLWSAREIGYIEDLVAAVGSTAKHQLYSVIFSGKRQKNLAKDYLALRFKIGGRICYSFSISAKELLNYAYVHHRHLTGIVEASQAYQRMLMPGKLKQIARFIDTEDGFFPNSIILNFTEQLRWNHKESMGDVAMGTITLPEYYGSAWVIDGQHRLYGVASAERDIVIPVLAFERINQRDQANLFVDINEKQKRVPAHLLWDLYSDIYRDSADDKQKRLYQIAETAKQMSECGPLKGIIDIPSIPQERHVKLSLTTICTTIEKHSPWDHLKHRDDTKTPENAARIFNSYFGVLKSLWPEDWGKGNKGVLLTNNGFGVFTMLFHDIVNDLMYKQQGHLLRQNKKLEFEEELSKTYLKPILEYLKTQPSMQGDIRRATGRGPQSYTAGLLDVQLQQFVKDYSPPRVGDIPIPQTAKQPAGIPTIEEKARAAEGHLRCFVLERLKSNYGSDKWWKQGLTKGAKDKADKKWEEEVTRKPFLKSEERSNDRKFEFLGLGDMIEIVCYGTNWEDIFQSVFIDKVNFQRRIKDILVLRNPSSHVRGMDDQDVADGISGLLWLSKCLAIPSINPYS